MLLKVESYIGVDYKIEGREEGQKEVDVFYDGKTIPFKDAEFDSLLSTEVLEHVFNIDELLLEFNRVLKINGQAIITTPFMWEEHEMPYDFARYTTPALEYLYQKHGFEIIHKYKTVQEDDVCPKPLCLLSFLSSALGFVSNTATNFSTRFGS